MILCRVATVAEWAAAEKEGEMPVDADGFLHLSTPEQVEFVLAQHFEGATDLVVLHVASESLPEDCLQWEMVDDGHFPHLYSPLPVSAVVRIEAR